MAHKVFERYEILRVQPDSKISPRYYYYFFGHQSVYLSRFRVKGTVSFFSIYVYVTECHCQRSISGSKVNTSRG